MLALVNGEVQNQVSVFDRGLQYGDGVFETILFRADIPVLISFHLQRFKLGARRLNIPIPVDFEAQYERAIALHKDLVAPKEAEHGSYICKIVLTRGVGGRGYRPVDVSSPTLIISFHNMPVYPGTYKNRGVDAIICKHRLSENSSMAGIKHLNRLDQIMASAELDGFPEGIMCDQKGNLVEGTRSNILVFSGGKVLTPELKSCGVEGCMRRFLLSKSEIGALGINIIEQVIPLSQLNQIDGMAFINSVFGLWPVARVADRTFIVTPECKLLSQYIYQELGI